MEEHQQLLEDARQGEAYSLPGTPPELGKRKLYIESYGCAMNFADSEIVASIMQNDGFAITTDTKEADVILINTCSIRENAELRVRKRLTDFRSSKQSKPSLLVGVLGCMAERLKSKFLEEEKLVDLVVGPDAYRDLPRLLEEAGTGQKAVNVLLSREETYADISPLRFSSNGISAYVSIMRGCNNMCSFCVVPYTRGRERSRHAGSIVEEVKNLSAEGFKEIVLLGQNVDSYSFASGAEKISFAGLLEMVACVDSTMRIRFSTSHPKDITDEVLYVMAAHDNICKYIHLPVQSGSSRILKMMNRTYDREWYMNRVEAIRRILPGCGISTDTITGFCSETEEDHQETLSIMEEVRFDFAYMFKYSERPGTPAAKNFEDDVPEEVKSRRLTEIITLQKQHSYARLLSQIGTRHTVLVEGTSKKSLLDLSGRNDRNAMVVFPSPGNINPGEYADVIIRDCTSATLLADFIPAELKN